MKSLLITRTGNIELARGFLNQPSVLIGRSPVCDIVVRESSLKPIHYLLEWIGEGEFSAEQASQSGEWALIDISLEASEESRQKAGQGQVLSSKATHIHGFQFLIKEEGLSETFLPVNALKKSIESESGIEKNKRSEIKLDQQNSIIEIIQLRRNSQSVENVYHVNSTLDVKENKKVKKESKTQYFSQIFKNTLGFADFFNIQWLAKKNALPQIKLTQSPQIKIWNKGESVHSHAGVLTLNTFDFYSIETEVYDFYIRVVKKINTSRLKPRVWEDQLYRNALFILLLFLLFYFLAFDYFRIVEDKTPPPPKRVARVEVKGPAEVVPVPPPPVPLEPVPEVEKPIEAKPVEKAPPPKEIVQKQETKPLKSTTGAQPAKSAAPPTAAAPKFTSQKPAPVNPGLNSPAPKTDVNKVGIAGLFNKSAPGEKINPNKIIDPVQLDRANSANPKTILSQGQSGTVANSAFRQTKNPGAGGSDKLTSAGTTLSATGPGQDTSIAPIANQGGRGNGLGESLGSLSGAGAGGGYSEIESLEKGFQVEGGLDKETVRRVIQANRRKITICYNQAIISNPRMGGKIIFQWMIAGSSGNVLSVAKKESEIKNVPAFENCLQDVILGMQFPAAGNGRNTTVIYPFIFTQKN